MPVGSAPSEMLRALRPDVARRPPVDAGLAGGLRAWLEDGVAAALDGPAAGTSTTGGDGAPPLVVDRWSLAAAPSGPTGPSGPTSPSGPGAMTVASARQAMVECLFRQALTTGVAAERPFDAAVAGLRVTVGGTEVLAFVSQLPRARREALRREVTDHGRALATGWPALPASWLPSNGVRRSVPLAGGRVVLRASAPLALGPPAVDRASVCLVDVRAGAPQPEHRDDRRLLALAETLSAGAAPCRVATYYPASCRVDADDPDDNMLAITVVAVIDALHRLVGLEAACKEGR